MAVGRFTGLQPTAVLRPVQPTWLGATPSSLGTPCTASAFTAPRHASRVRPRASGQAQPSCPPADDGQVDGIHPRSPNDLRSETAQADIASPYVQFVPVPRVSQWPAHDGTRLQIEARLAGNHRPNWQADVPPCANNSSIGNSPSAVGSSQMRDVSQTCSKKTPASGCGSCMRGITLCLPNGACLTCNGPAPEPAAQAQDQQKAASPPPKPKSSGSDMISGPLPSSSSCYAAAVDRCLQDRRF